MKMKNRNVTIQVEVASNLFLRCLREFKNNVHEQDDNENSIYEVQYNKQQFSRMIIIEGEMGAWKTGTIIENSLQMKQILNFKPFISTNISHADLIHVQSLTNTHPD